MLCVVPEEKNFISMKRRGVCTVSASSWQIPADHGFYSLEIRAKK